MIYYQMKKQYTGHVPNFQKYMREANNIHMREIKA